MDAYTEVGDRATHDYRDIGGRVTPGAVTEDAKAEVIGRVESGTETENDSGRLQGRKW